MRPPLASLPSKADATITVMTADAILAGDALVAGKPLIRPPLLDVCRFTSPFIPISGVALHQVTIYHRSPSAGRGGNRQLNAALHRIAITQLRLPGPGQGYYQRRRAQGDGTGDAVRARKRRIVRAVYKHPKQAEQRVRAGSPTAT
jgi:hypothetical protein